MVTYCQVSRQVTTVHGQRKSPRLSQKAQSSFTTKLAFAKINWNLQTEIDACSPTLISCMLEPIWILKASPMKSSYTAAIIKMIFYLQGLKAILNHEPTSEQGTPSLWDKCMKWKYSQGLWWVSIYSMYNPARQFSAQGMLPRLHAESCNRQLGALPTARTVRASTRDGLPPGCWAHRAAQGPLLSAPPPPDVPHWGPRTPSHL